MSNATLDRNDHEACELPECRHRLCACGHAECGHADENVQPNCSECHCNGFRLQHGDTSPCIDREEQELCEWAFNGGDPDTGVEWCWNCKTCGCVDINREPPNDD